MSLEILKMLAFMGALLAASIGDLKTKRISNRIPLFIALIGLIQMDVANALRGLIFVPLPYLVMALIKENSMGGGDIKLMGACGFFLGLQTGYVASILGLLFAITVHFAFRAFGSKNTNKNIPLAPYLSAGCLIAYFIVK